MRQFLPIIGLLTAMLGFVVYASPSATDQAMGTLIMAWGAAMVVAYFVPSLADNRRLHWALAAPFLLFLGYCVMARA